ncbi:MAG: sulfotransferase family protein [Longimicrobiales bacterium]
MTRSFRIKRAGKRALLPVVQVRDRLALSDLRAGATTWRARVATDEWLEPTPFFVLGSPRSGTTLLRAMLCAHPELVIPPENGGLVEMLRAFGNARRGPWDELVQKVLDPFRRAYEFDHWDIDLASVTEAADRLPTEERSLARLVRLVYQQYQSHHAPNKARWGDKSTPGTFRHVSSVARLFPRAQFIHIVRDGRDCVSSCVRAGFYSGSYQKAAYAWRDNVRECYRLGRRLASGGRFHELKYEDLVESPADEAARLCEFLGFEAADSMLEHHRTVSDSVPDVLEIQHHENVRRPISTASRGRWRSEVPPDQLRGITRILGSQLRVHGYA